MTPQKMAENEGRARNRLAQRLAQVIADAEAPAERIDDDEKVAAVLAATTLEPFTDLATPDEIGAAVDMLKAAEESVEAAEAYAKATVAYAKRRERFFREALWPAVSEWARNNPPAKGKTIGLPGTNRVLQWRSHDEKVVLFDRRLAEDFLRSKFSEMELVDAGALKTRVELSESGVKAVVLENPGLSIPGTVVEPAGEKLIITKKRGT